MMLLIFGLVISCCFITVIGDGITRNHLNESYQNKGHELFNPFLDDITSTNVTINTARRLKIKCKKHKNVRHIAEFKTDRFLGVALIISKGLQPDPSKPWRCTGAYFKRGEGKYLLTAAHCIFDKTRNDNIGTFWPQSKVKFGVTKKKPNGDVACTVEHVRVNNAYPSQEKIEPTGNDYAILKLGGYDCNPGKAYEMLPFPNELETVVRAGYTGTHTMTVYTERVKKQQSQCSQHNLVCTYLPHPNKVPEEEGLHQINFEKFGGDSGGPLFEARDKKMHIVGILHNGNVPYEGYRGSVKLSDEIIETINNYILKKDGISKSTKNCQTSAPSEECWSICGPKQPSKTNCFSHDTKTRALSKPIRKIRCKRRGNEFDHQYLCDPIKGSVHTAKPAIAAKDCTDITPATDRCWSPYIKKSAKNPKICYESSAGRRKYAKPKKQQAKIETPTVTWHFLCGPIVGAGAAHINDDNYYGYGYNEYDYNGEYNIDTLYYEAKKNLLTAKNDFVIAQQLKQENEAKQHKNAPSIPRLIRWHKYN